MDNDLPSALIVDDDEVLRNILAYKLERRGFQVLHAEDGPAALAALEARRIDVMVLDIMMPKMDGFYLLRKAQESDDLAPRTTVVLSARGEEEDILKSFELGAVDYVTKPFSMNVLIARIEVALKHKAR